MAWPTTAHAYRTFADDPEVQVAARRSESTLRWDLHAPPGEAALLDVQAAAQQGYASWAAPACTSFRAEFAGVSDTPASPGDSRNTIEIVRAGWAARGFPTGRGATTDVQLLVTEDYGIRQAEITEADIYLNYEEYQFSLDGMGPVASLDLVAVLTHEIGHQAISLRHPCEISSAGEPLCEVLPEARVSVMFPEYLGPSQRVLSADDVSGVCDLYPAEGCPLSCGIARRCAEMMACEACVEGDCAPRCVGPTCTPEPGLSCDPMTPCERGVCATFYGDTGSCATSGALGTPCVMGEECETGLCLVRREEAPSERVGYCTSRCAVAADCPEGQFCGADNVCRPPPVASCSATPARAGRTSLIALAALAVASWRARRRPLVRTRNCLS